MDSALQDQQPRFCLLQNCCRKLSMSQAQQRTYRRVGSRERSRRMGNWFECGEDLAKVLTGKTIYIVGVD